MHARARVCYGYRSYPPVFPLNVTVKKTSILISFFFYFVRFQVYAHAYVSYGFRSYLSGNFSENVLYILEEHVPGDKLTSSIAMSPV